MVRSAGAIVVGFLFIGAMSFGADAVLRALMPGAYDAAGRVADVPTLFVIQAYVGVFAITGCYLAARLAGRRPMLHALVLGGFGLIFNIVAVITLWETAPAWYHVLSLVLVLPYAWVGGRIREAQVDRADGRATAAVA